MQEPSIYDNIQTAVEFIRSRVDVVPEMAVVLGSGMGGFAEEVVGSVIAYEDIPGFRNSTVQTHAGSLHIGNFAGRTIAVMRGRLHRYEGYSSSEVVFPLRVLAALGVKSVILTNASGALNGAYQVGDMHLLEDHVSLANLAGEDPLRFGYEPGLGERFVSLNGAYDRSMLKKAQSVAMNCEEKMEKAVYAYVTGPAFETPAEIRLLKMMGCDVVGMSTVPEVIAARQAGLAVLGITAITNVTVDSCEDSYVTNAEDIFTALDNIGPRMARLLGELVRQL